MTLHSKAKTDIILSNDTQMLNIKNMIQLKMSCTLLESSFIDWMRELLGSCVSEIMKGCDPASNTLWIFPESAETENKSSNFKHYYAKQ